MQRTAELVLAVCVTGFLAFSLGSCGTDAVARERDRAMELANEYRWQRDSTQMLQAKTDTFTRVVIRTDRRVAAERDSLISVLTYADSVLADTAATLEAMRVTLGVTIARARSYQTSVDSLQGQMRELVAAHALERLAVNTTLIAADSAVAGYKAVADAERRKGWRRFTEGAFVGGIVALILVVAL
jgi:Tfp pilus assembly protein PilV